LEFVELSFFRLEKQRTSDVCAGGVPVTMSMVRQSPFGLCLRVVTVAGKPIIETADRFGEFA
jgi:hypothetical protein